MRHTKYFHYIYLLILRKDSLSRSLYTLILRATQERAQNEVTRVELHKALQVTQASKAMIGDLNT